MSDPAGFRGLEFPGVIDTASTEFIEEFYVPLLSQADIYKRGVGYFTANWIESAARGMCALAANGGTAQWLTSPILEEADLEAIRKGDEAKRNRVLRDSLRADVEDLETALKEDTRNALAWLIADGILEIKFAVPDSGAGAQFHDKWGVFVDEHKNRVAFHGSQNDSHQAQLNYESYDVFCDWHHEADAERVRTHEERFDRLWEGHQNGLDIYEIPEVIKDGIVELRTNSARPYERPDAESVDGTDIELRSYQQEAVSAWFENGHRGIFEMATGTGKTYTAIGALRRLKNELSQSLLTVIAVPYTHLARQWDESLEEWNIQRAKFIYGTANPDWKNDLSRIVSDLQVGVRDDTTLITTHTTFGHGFFETQLEKLSTPTLLIADEVHGLGSEHRRQALSESYDSRLGLSATPTRYFDEAGTDALKEYFEGVVYEFDIGDAIPGYLTEYDYHPRLIEMTEEELEQYAGISRKLAAEMGKESPDQDRIDRLLIKRARIIKAAENKLGALREIVRQLQHENSADHLLVYTNPKQIDQAQEVLNDLGLVQHRFTNEEDDEEREQLLAGFAEGRYDALVAMKCLDEGVDVPSTQRAILMSNSQNPKQFIQRRGRVLRRADELGKNHAEIYDMIVVPTLNPSRSVVDSEKNILRRELTRFEEFADDARNNAQARNQIQRLRTEYEI